MLEGVIGAWKTRTGPKVFFALHDGRLHTETTALLPRAPQMPKKVWKPACGRLCETVEILNLHAITTPGFPGASTSKHQLGPRWESEETAAATTSHHNNQQHDRANIRKRNVALGNLVKTPLGMVAGSDHFCWRFSPGAAAFEFFSP